MLTRIESTDYPRATTIVFKQEYPITLTMGGLGQMSTSNSYRTTSTVFNLIKRYKCWCNDIHDAILTGDVGHDTCLTIMKK